MKGLTLTQPWATLVAIGEKEWETRSWSTKYRGPIAIHAAKGFPREAKVMARMPVFEAAHNHAVDELPLGCMIAVGLLADIQPTGAVRGKLSFEERQFGDFSEGRFAWKLDSVFWLPKPFTFTGALGLYDLTKATERLIFKQLDRAERKAIFGKVTL